MTTPFAELTEQELGVLETRRAMRHGAGVDFELASLVLEFECGNGNLAAQPSVALDLPLGEAP